MSIDLITEVRRRLAVSGGELLVAIELADAANDHGAGIFVGVCRMADRSRQDPRTVQRQLKRLVEVGWLEVVKRGGGRRADGSGIPTTYRINPAWIKGDKLPGLPDYVPQFYTQEKGDNLSPLPEDNGDKEGGSTVTKTPNKGDTAVSGDPLTRIPEDARARATPSGSRAATGTTKTAKLPPAPPEFDERVSRARWWNVAVSEACSPCQVLGITRDRISRLDELPTYPRSVLEPLAREMTAWAVDEQRRVWPHWQQHDQRIEGEVTARIRRTLNDIKPGSAAEQSSRAA